MDIKSLKELSKIIDLCRKKGIESVKIGQECIEMKFGEVRQPTRRKNSKAFEPVTDSVETPDAFDEMQALFWSSEGIPVEGAN